MSSRDDILASVRRNAKTVAPDLPDLEADWIQYADLQQQFSEVIETVGGRCVAAESDHDINNALKAIPEYSSASKIASTIPGIGESNVSLSEIDDPHELEDVDFAILPGEFAVAENGAVWVTDKDLKQRAVMFITQHLVLVVPGGEIVPHMHAAYERLHFGPAGFGVFISGPSKTADIEQSLVIGAHGPRSLTVFLTSN